MLEQMRKSSQSLLITVLFTILIDWEVTMPPREITATSVVPPPMSTTMLPVGSLIGRPAPIAAAIGSSMM